MLACRKWHGVSGSSLGADHPVIWEVDLGPLSPPGRPGLSSTCQRTQKALEQVNGCAPSRRQEGPLEDGLAAGEAGPAKQPAKGEEDQFGRQAQTEGTGYDVCLDGKVAARGADWSQRLVTERNMGQR